MAFIGNPLVSMNYPVDYFTGDGTSTDFNLSKYPASASSVIVSVNGIKYVSSSINPEYSIVANKLNFFNPPALNAKIEVVYLGILDRKSTRLNSSHIPLSRMPSSA